MSYIDQCKVDRAAFVVNGAAFLLIILKFNSGNNTHGATRQGLFLLDPEGVVRLALLGQKVSAPSLPGLVQSAVDGL